MTNVSQGAFSVIAERFRRAGQADRAVDVCREGLALYPEHLSARVTLGCALMDLGQDLEAHKELQAVLRRAPDNLAAIRGLAELHARGVEGQDAQDAQDAQVAREVMDAEDARVALDAQAGPDPQVPLDPETALDPPVALDPLVTADEPFATAPAVSLAAPAKLEELQFAIEDVIGLDPCLDPELDPVMDSDSELDPYMEPQSMSVSSPEAVPAPDVASGAIAELDVWLIRIRARRSELLSEYAAS